ncbi:hypothetical protein EGI26_08510 [Lacihabitans sp. CCS-44]|uniref:hypothetical protein n=1 Tax=Lacihabitans sp. CCS-44 TaxID=2487331 RepID=UPI0020CD89BD|nr:hypothetical protein [Lacihabitans sp. CCS-44]MCP9755193.1 hypothetical protein [Lacihabitans sp. CCS-44]
MPSIYYAYDKVEFRCDATGHFGLYLDFHLVWYETMLKEEGKSVNVYRNFMLISKGDGFSRIPKTIFFDEQTLSLSHVPLKLAFRKNGGIMPLLCQILNPLTVYSGSVSISRVDIVSFTEVLRRLTIWGYEDVRDNFKQFVRFEEFSGYTEEQMLETDNLLKLKKLLDNL